MPTRSIASIIDLLPKSVGLTQSSKSLTFAEVLDWRSHLGPCGTVAAAIQCL